MSDEIFWKGTSFAGSILGVEETVSNINTSNLKKHFLKIFTGSNMLIFVAGKIKPNAIYKETNRAFKDVKREQSRSFKYPYFNQTSPVVKFVSSDSASVSVSLRFPTIDEKEKDFSCVELLNNLLGGSDHSRLFLSLREKKGLTYGVYSTVYSNFLKQGFMDIQFESQPQNILLVLEEIFSIIKKIQTELVSEQELNLARASLELDIATKLDDIESIDDYYALPIMLGTFKEVSKKISELRAVSREEIHSTAKDIFSHMLFTLVAVGSLTQKQKKEIRVFVKKISE